MASCASCRLTDRAYTLHDTNQARTAGECEDDKPSGIQRHVFRGAYCLHQQGDEDVNKKKFMKMITLASYSGDLGFKSRRRDRLS